MMRPSSVRLTVTGEVTERLKTTGVGPPQTVEPSGAKPVSDSEISLSEIAMREVASTLLMSLVLVETL